MTLTPNEVNNLLNYETELINNLMPDFNQYTPSQLESEIKALETQVAVLDTATDADSCGQAMLMHLKIARMHSALRAKELEEEVKNFTFKPLINN